MLGYKILYNDTSAHSLEDDNKDTNKDDEMESVRAKHAAELEAKRRKLEEIRKRKASVRCVHRFMPR